MIILQSFRQLDQLGSMRRFKFFQSQVSVWQYRVELLPVSEWQIWTQTEAGQNLKSTAAVIWYNVIVIILCVFYSIVYFCSDGIQPIRQRAFSVNLPSLKDSASFFIWLIICSSLRRSASECSFVNRSISSFWPTSDSFRADNSSDKTLSQTFIPAVWGNMNNPNQMSNNHRSKSMKII